MASRSSSPMRLPPAVRAAALVATGGGRLQKELAWMSWAGTVWRLEGQSGVVYVKRAGDLQDEHDRTVWMAGRVPPPEVSGLFHAFPAARLLTPPRVNSPTRDSTAGPDAKTRCRTQSRSGHDVGPRRARPPPTTQRWRGKTRSRNVCPDVPTHQSRRIRTGRCSLKLSTPIQSVIRRAHDRTAIKAQPPQEGRGALRGQKIPVPEWGHPTSSIRLEESHQTQTRSIPSRS